MPYKTQYEPGQHNVVCAVCQAVFKSRDVERDWRGWLVCYKDIDPRPAGKLDKARTANDPQPVRDIQGPEVITYRTDS